MNRRKFLKSAALPIAAVVPKTVIGQDSGVIRIEQKHGFVIIDPITRRVYVEGNPDLASFHRSVQEVMDDHAEYPQLTYRLAHLLFQFNLDHWKWSPSDLGKFTNGVIMDSDYVNIHYLLGDKNSEDYVHTVNGLELELDWANQVRVSKSFLQYRENEFMSVHTKTYRVSRTVHELEVPGNDIIYIPV